MTNARIKLTSYDQKKLDSVCDSIIRIADKTGAKRSGKIPLPTKRMKVPVRKSPCGGGTESYEKWEMRIHKRLIDVKADDRTLRHIMKVDMPEEVHIEIDLLD